MNRNKTKTRIYVCHTFYHVYVSILKEMKLQRNSAHYEKADIALSRLSSDFSELEERLRGTDIFQEVLVLDEKREEFFPQLAKYRKNYSNIFKHMINRMIFTKQLAKCEEPYMTIDFAAYKDVYVYCDSDPIGYYLNYKKIYYHAVEDGLDCLKNLDDAYVANAGHFKLKTWFSRHNLIFIMNGWGKYCLDMEINDRSVVPTDCPRFVVEPRKPMERALTSEQKRLMIQAFIPDADALLAQLSPREGEEFFMFMTQPYPVEEELRKRICLDVIAQYGKGYRVLINPLPWDLIDYVDLCPDCVVIRGRFPIEVMNFFEGVRIKRGVSIVTTAMDSMDCIDEKINLGVDFWDAYEPRDKHAFNRKAGLTLANQSMVKS